jgi:hypothetical protein
VRKSLLICALAGLAASSAQSAEKAAEKAIDADLLEFLGSLDSEETGWHDYLEQGAVKAGKAPSKAPVKSPAPTAPADVKQVKSK